MTKVEKISSNLVDIVKEKIFPATIEIENGKIISIKPTSKEVKGYMIPGFVDAHIHIESSMIPPSEFARLALPHGTVATVSDPHEIGNVLGIEGVEYMIENAAKVPLKFYFGAPSCVPATSFETSGATIGPDEIRSLLSRKEIKYLSEVMNFPGVIYNDPMVMEKVKIAKELKKRIDGHAPGVRGDNLKKYVAAGIQTDHECTELEEAEEKRDLGMKILVREGSAARNFDALYPLMKKDPDNCMLCTDDTHPDSLLHGHINLLVKKAVSRGMDVIKVLRCASYNTIKHYGLEVGLLQEGDPADFILVDNLKDFNIEATYIDGIRVAEKGDVLFPRTIPQVINRFNTSKKKSSDFVVRSRPGRLKVIEAIDGELITNLLEVDPTEENGQVVSDLKKDILKIAVVNRYANTPPSVAFIKNFGLKKGAIASSVAHDSHNIIAVGASDEELCQAVNSVISHQGGIAVINQDKEECLPLPIAGLMSDLEGYIVAEKYKSLDKKAKALGCHLRAPFMTLSFMALLVIPRLKLSDLGLFDQKPFAFTDLFTSPEKQKAIY